MNLESIRQALCDLVEGGPGSGRYPAGSGKNPDAPVSRPRTNTANKNQGSNWIRRTTRVKLYKRDGWKCRYCAKRVTQGGPLKSRATLDHLDANHKNNEHNNLATVCYSCNSSRKNTSEEDFKKSIGLAAGLELGKETFMNFDTVKKFVDEFVESLFEGGPGSGRYPAGTGKSPTLDDNVGGEKLPKLKLRRGDFESARDKAELLTNKAKQENSYQSHKQAQRVHERASKVAELQGRNNESDYHSGQATDHRRTADAVRRAERDKAKEANQPPTAEPSSAEPSPTPLRTGLREPRSMPDDLPHELMKSAIRNSIASETAASLAREKEPTKEKPRSVADDKAGAEPHKHSHSEKADRIVDELKGNKKIRVVFNPNDNSIEIKGGNKQAHIRYRNQTSEDAEKIYDELGKRVGGKKSLTLAHTEPKAKSEARYRRKLAKFGFHDEG